MTRRLPLPGLLALALLLPALEAGAYVRTQSTSGMCLWWGSRALSYSVHEDLGGDPDAREAELSAVQASFRSWTDATCSDVEFVFEELTPRRAIGYDAEGPVNLVLWRTARCADFVAADDPCWDCALNGEACCDDAHDCWDHRPGIIAVTTTTFQSTTGALLDADIELNGADFWFTTADAACDDPRVADRCTTDAECGDRRCWQGVCLDRDCARTDIANTVTHEVGHVLGLDHTSVAGATMADTAAAGETHKRTLAPDDVQGLCDIYPDQGPTLTCLGMEVVMTPLATSDEVGGCGGCASGSGGSSLLALGAVVAGLRALRRRRRAA